MKFKNPISGVATIILATILLFACNKNNDNNTGNNMTAAAKSVAGKLEKGKVTTTSDAEGLLLHINDLHIIVSQLPGTKLSPLPDLSSAEVITSEHGLIVKDLANGNVYFLVNNNEESARQFNVIASLFPSTVRNNVIFGTTIVRSANS